MTLPGRPSALATATGNIQNIDPMPVASINLNTSVTNGTGVVVADFTVTLSSTASQDVTVNYSLSPGASDPSMGYEAAEPGEDYNNPTQRMGNHCGRAKLGHDCSPDRQRHGGRAGRGFLRHAHGRDERVVAQSDNQGTGWIANNLPWVVNSTGDLPAKDPSASPWTGQNNALGDDHPECTLKSIIQYLEAPGNSTGNNTVAFAIPHADRNFDGNVYTITTSGLPAITVPMTIDGSTGSPNNLGTPNIDVVGEGGGFVVSAGPTTIKYLAVSGSGGTGVLINDTTGGDTVQGCYLGVARRAQRRPATSATAWKSTTRRRTPFRIM